MADMGWQLALGAIVILSAALIALAAWQYRLQQRLNDLELSNQEMLVKMRQEMAAVSSASVGVGQRLLNAEKKLKQAVEKQQAQIFAQSASGATVQAAYEKARESDVEELTGRYGLSEAEADLLKLMQEKAPSNSA